jgi:hypothetical protein
MEATCKLGSKGCWNDGKCRATSNCECKVITNADNIRSMNDEELSQFLWEFDLEVVARESDFMLTRRKVCEWLKQPVEE